MHYDLFNCKFGISCYTTKIKNSNFLKIGINNFIKLRHNVALIRVKAKVCFACFAKNPCLGVIGKRNIFYGGEVIFKFDSTDFV